MTQNHDMIQKLALIAAAGALGTVARYGLAGLINRLGGPSFPWGTLAVNAAGCFVVGILWVLFENRWSVSAETRVIVLVGFMGAFTTFSAFILDSGELIESAQWMRAAANVALQNGIGFAALFAGAALGRMA
jgi:fluoride exporter